MNARGTGIAPHGSQRRRRKRRRIDKWEDRTYEAYVLGDRSLFEPRPSGRARLRRERAAIRSTGRRAVRAADRARQARRSRDAASRADAWAGRPDGEGYAAAADHQHHRTEHREDDSGGPGLRSNLRDAAHDGPDHRRRAAGWERPRPGGDEPPERYGNPSRAPSSGVKTV